MSDGGDHRQYCFEQVLSGLRIGDGGRGHVGEPVTVDHQDLGGTAENVHHHVAAWMLRFWRRCVLVKLLGKFLARQAEGAFHGQAVTDRFHTKSNKIALKQALQLRGERAKETDVHDSDYGGEEG